MARDYHVYEISETDLARLRIVTDRLYREDRLSGDDMRDLAQKLNCVIHNAIDSVPKKTPTAKFNLAGKPWP